MLFLSNSGKKSFNLGEMAERFIATISKIVITVVIEGSNPSLSFYYLIVGTNFMYFFIFISLSIILIFNNLS